jgi:23S rRNA (cytidine1920-2'-O)/16S rRNA (cytidine1409-2'-O)-methyltransferase
MQLDKSAFPVPPQAAVCDLAFRSVRGAAQHILGLVTADLLLAFIKPQFEWQQPAPTFDGVIREQEDLSAVLARLIDELWQEQSYITRVAASPITGKKGNREFFFLIQSKAEATREEILRATVNLLD